MGFPSIIEAISSGFSCGVNLRYLAANLQEKLCTISQGSWWLALKFPRGVLGVSRDNALFCLEIPEVAKAKNLKIKLQGVSRKYVSVFSEIARWQLTEVKKVFYSMHFQSILGFTYIYWAMAKSTNKNNTIA